MEAKDEDTKDMGMALTSYEDHNHHLETYNTELQDQVGELKQDVAMADASKAEQARIQTAMIALLEKDRDNKHKIVDEALIAVTNNDRDAIVKLQADMEDTTKTYKKTFNRYTKKHLQRNKANSNGNQKTDHYLHVRA